MKSYVFAPEAKDDVAEIRGYIRARDGARRALKVIDDITHGFQKVADAPWIGHKHSEIEDERLRVWRVHRWLIVFRHDVEPVEIVRALHGHRDIGSMEW